MDTQQLQLVVDEAAEKLSVPWPGHERGQTDWSDATMPGSAGCGEDGRT